MKKSMKLVTVAAGVIVFTGLAAFSGQFMGVTGASGDWQTNAINTANAEIGEAGYEKKEQLLKDANSDINEKIQSELSGTVDAKQKELESLLEQYYQMKLDGMTETEAFKEVERQIEVILQGSYERFKVEIDALFAEQA
ncbi:hypothetical protein [Bacillus sp. AG4(2022)]|uniref:hypothetical protein n=1 Tax=Bacillus sp. AG4(2022) TaxID=2962594 RepID=UPI002881578E|nr:hypothetical protein [Bacillus sp. AG4(2022)]MDT0160417.1 hypothetical protein [Bacillus sp. AG4(2022)]